ncbi:MAG: GNAT family N-acetyltransferase [Bacteroidota bacterium]
MTPTLHLAQLEDIPVLCTLMEEFYALDGYPFDEARSEQNLRQFLTQEHLGRFWRVEIEGVLAGYLALAFGFSFEYGGRDAFIDEFFLKEKYRGQGMGTQLIALVTQEAELLGVKALHLEVEMHNISGNRLYQKTGFQGSGRTLLSKRLD